MKYTRCPRCGLNYIRPDELLCSVCRDEIDGKHSIFDDDDPETVLCPYCEKNYMRFDELMCATCRRKRNRQEND